MECASSTSSSDWKKEIETVAALIVFQEELTNHVDHGFPKLTNSMKNY